MPRIIPSAGSTTTRRPYPHRDRGAGPGRTATPAGTLRSTWSNPLVIAPRREVYTSEAQALPAAEEEEERLIAEAERLAEERDGVEAAIALIEARTRPPR